MKHRNYIVIIFLFAQLSISSKSYAEPGTNLTGFICSLHGLTFGRVATENIQLCIVRLASISSITEIEHKNNYHADTLTDISLHDCIDVDPLR